VTARTVVAGLGTCLVTMALALLGLLEKAELGALDRLFELRGPRTPAAPILIVTIDEDSFDELDMPWPFPRALHAKLLDTISAGRPKAIAFDIIFPEQSAHGAADDASLGAAIRRAGNVVLASAITTVSEGFYRKIDMNLPLPVIRDGAAAVAPVNQVFDEDRHIRRAALRPRFREEVLDGWDIAIYKVAMAHGLAAAPLPSGSDEAFINFRGGPGTFPWIPYHRVVNGDVSPEVFRDTIVLIGATSAVLQDIFSTPFADIRGMPGVEIRANVLDMLIRGDPVHGVTRPVIFVFITLAAFGSAWLAARLLALRAFVAVALLTVMLFGVTFVVFVVGNWWFRPVGIAFALVVGYGATVVDNYIREQRERRRLSQFFSPSVLDEIVRHHGNEALGSARRHVSVLFSDIRGFTSMSEKVQPEQVAAMLREYLTEMTAVVFRHRGTVDKYIGDCIMALYNAPLEDPDHAANAVSTGLDLLERAQAVSARWELKLGVQIRNGVGVHTGDAVVGAMGSEQRLEYTAIGDTVNLASRLEGLTKEHAVGMIISESTYAAVEGRFATRELGAVTVKGKAAPVKIYAVLPGIRRNHRRAVLRTAATVVPVGGGPAWLVSTRDVSEGGVSVNGLPLGVATGTMVRMQCDDGALPKPLRADGRVVWRNGLQAGIAFTAIEAEGGAALGHYLAADRSEPPATACPPGR
jgi:adenylate cyclase